MSLELELSSFLAHPGVILDVRTPLEFSHAKIPDSLNLPLLSNEERVIIGTLYKGHGKEKAIDEALRLVGPRLSGLAALAKSLVTTHNPKVYCWRGGMRSASVAWLLNLTGLKPVILKGGYKTFRSYVIHTLSHHISSFQFHVLGGLTGSGKTALLQKLKKQGEQVLDLEALAHHRGSSFGMLGMSKSPSNEQFENSIVWTLSSFTSVKPIWVEDESRLIGQCQLPNSLYQIMQNSPLFIKEASLEERLERLSQEYGIFGKDKLIECTLKIKKRLGGARTKEAVQLIHLGKLKEALRILLLYYDRTYTQSIEKRQKLINILQLDRL